MAIYDQLRAQRLKHRQAIAHQKIVTFRLQKEWFALLVHQVVKVIPLESIYGDPQQQGVSLTTYRGKELLVIDVGHRIFGQSRLNSSLPQPIRQTIMPESVQPMATDNPPAYLLILERSSGEWAGIPIDSPPTIRRVPESSFAPLPQDYLTLSGIQCLSSTCILEAGQSPIFFLDDDRLTERPEPIPRPSETAMVPSFEAASSSKMDDAASHPSLAEPELPIFEEVELDPSALDFVDTLDHF